MRYVNSDMIPAGTCTFCGAKADAEWWGDNTIRVCHRCAMEVLPALIADAVALEQARHPVALWDEVSTVFWRALAIRLDRDQRQPSDSRRREENHVIALAAAYPEGINVKEVEGHLVAKIAPMPDPVG